MAQTAAISFDHAELGRLERMMSGHLSASGAHCGDDDDLGHGAIATGAHCGDDDGEG